LHLHICEKTHILEEKFHDKLKIRPATIFPLFQYHLYLRNCREIYTCERALYMLLVIKRLKGPSNVPVDEHVRVYFEAVFREQTVNYWFPFRKPPSSSSRNKSNFIIRIIESTSLKWTSYRKQCILQCILSRVSSCLKHKWNNSCWFFIFFHMNIHNLSIITLHWKWYQLIYIHILYSI